MNLSDYYSDVGCADFEDSSRQAQLYHSHNTKQQINNANCNGRTVHNDDMRYDSLVTPISGSSHFNYSMERKDTQKNDDDTHPSQSQPYSARYSARHRAMSPSLLQSPSSMLTPQSSWASTPPRVVAPSSLRHNISKHPSENIEYEQSAGMKNSSTHVRDRERTYHVYDSLEKELEKLSIEQSRPIAELSQLDVVSKPSYQQCAFLSVDHEDDCVSLQCGECLEYESDPHRGFFVEILCQWFHSICFRCDVCHLPFSNERPFIPHEGKAYCEADYAKYYMNPCASCRKPIRNESPIYAFGKMYHERHVRCNVCKVKLQGRLYQYQHQLYCLKHYERMISKCPVCHEPIQGDCIQALGAVMHRHCFGCETCRRPFPNKQFFVHDNKAYCKLHYHIASNTFCYTCNTPIQGTCIDVNEQGRRYHPDCWRCASCKNPIHGTYFSLHGQPYCPQDIDFIAKKLGGRPEKRMTIMSQLN